MAKKKLKFLEQAEGAGEELKNINARVEKSLYDDWNKCVKFAKQNGYNLSLKRVIRNAMIEAVEEVRSMPEAQGKLDV